MSNNIIVSADQVIVCPKCSNSFALRLGLTQRTIEEYASQYRAEVSAERKEAEQRFALEAKAQISKAQAEARAKAEADFEVEKKSFAQEMADKNSKLADSRERELKLLAAKKELEDARENMQLEIARRLDEETQKLRKQIFDTESERFALREAEFKKQMDDAKKANEDLRRKLEQGSQQLQGEVLELELENVLADAFRHDLIEEVKKGQRGADILQTVRTPSGQNCGKIIWEAKRAENWSDRWLTKLKDDQLEAKADIPVLVTTAMPKGNMEPFYMIGDVWVVAPHVMRPVAETLRIILLEANRLKLVNTGRNEKTELLYNYLSSSQFAQQVRTILESFELMRSELDAEKRAIQKIWAKRHAQIDRVTGSMAGIVGQLQAIANDSFAQLESISQLALPDSDTGSA